jgi:hypothetical protein
MNYDLWAGIQSLKPVILVTRGKNRGLTLRRMLRLIRTAIFAKNIFFKMTDTLPAHRRFIHLLKKVSRTVEVRCYLRPWTEEMANNLRIEEGVVRKRRHREDKKDELDSEYDYFISTITGGQFKNRFGISINPEKILQVGYPKRLPGWKEFLVNRARESRIVSNGRYCLYIVGPLEKRIEVLDEPKGQELLEETLTVLKRFEGDIKTVFKPHAATEVKKLEESIQKVGFKNYAVDYGHAMVLASGAEFVISYYYSETMIDAYSLGKPIVEYNALDRELLSSYGNWSIAGKCCDFFIDRKPEELAERLKNLITKEVSVTRDPVYMSENFRETGPEFYTFLGRLFQ